jgi:hypothetical protein
MNNKPNRHIKSDSVKLSFFCKGPQKSRQVYSAVYVGVRIFGYKLNNG